MFFGVEFRAFKAAPAVFEGSRQDESEIEGAEEANGRDSRPSSCPPRGSKMHFSAACERHSFCAFHFGHLIGLRLGLKAGEVGEKADFLSSPQEDRTHRRAELLLSVIPSRPGPFSYFKPSNGQVMASQTMENNLNISTFSG